MGTVYEPCPTPRLRSIPDTRQATKISSSVAVNGMSYGTTAFEAYREVAETACIVAALHRVGDEGWELHQAVCGALLVRISKYMVSICKLGHGEEHGETMFALTRCVTESAINLQFLLSKNDPRYFERFIEDGTESREGTLQADNRQSFEPRRQVFGHRTEHDGVHRKRFPQIAAEPER